MGAQIYLTFVGFSFLRSQHWAGPSLLKVFRILLQIVSADGKLFGSFCSAIQKHAYLVLNIAGRNSWRWVVPCQWEQSAFNRFHVFQVSHIVSSDSRNDWLTDRIHMGTQRVNFETQNSNSFGTYPESHLPGGNRNLFAMTQCSNFPTNIRSRLELSLFYLARCLCFILAMRNLEQSCWWLAGVCLPSYHSIPMRLHGCNLIKSQRAVAVAW